MAATLADLADAAHQAEDRLGALTRGTAAWIAAQRALVRTRAAFWTAMQERWDLDHQLRPTVRRHR
jgi:hypothetical protein